MSSHTIAPFHITDLPHLLHLEHEIFPEDAFDLATFLSFYLSGHDTFLVARDDGHMVGYVVASLSDRRGYIASVGVVQAVRGHGLGRRLMEIVIQRLIDKGARRIALHVRHDNQAAIHLYANLGFKEIETVPHYYEDGTLAVYMEKSVS